MTYLFRMIQILQIPIDENILNFLEEHKTIQQKKNLTFNEKYLSRLYQTQFLKATIIFAIFNSCLVFQLVLMPWV